MRKAGGRGGGPGGVPGGRCSGVGVCVLRRPLRSGTARQQPALNALPEETCPPFPPFLFSSAGGEGRGSRALRWGGQRRPALRLGPPLSPGRPADSPPWRGEKDPPADFSGLFGESSLKTSQVTLVWSSWWKKSFIPS